jgi:hypothetical protein
MTFKEQCFFSALLYPPGYLFYAKEKVICSWCITWIAWDDCVGYGEEGGRMN